VLQSCGAAVGAVRCLRSEVRGGRLRLRIKSEELRFKRKEGGGIKE
jgi:hypothetical protein